MNQPNIIKNRDIIIVGQQPWDVEIGSNCKNIALEFSKHNRVLYVNSPLDRITLLRSRKDPKVQKRIHVIEGKSDSLIKIADNLWNYYPDKMIESINWIKNQALFDKLNKYNNRIFANSIKKAADQLGFSNVILFNDNDIFRSFYLKDFLHPAKSVYYSRDYLLAVDYWKTHGEVLEPKIIAKSDVCVANSPYLSDYCKRNNPHSYYVGQGCELDLFTSYNSRVKPLDIRFLNTPMIGYVGALQSIRLDIELLQYIAVQKPDWTLVLVGPEDEQFKESALHQMDNVFFAGPKPPEQLPAYIHAFDVCLNPQLVNEVTIGNYPRKIDEYLAMGKPVVATRTEGMRIFEAHTYLGNTKEDYIQLIQQALKEDSNCMQQQRKAFAQQHTWENSVQEIYKAIINS
ncbi:glycosyltransferase family 1 protein [Ilyomonas limi]|uniref:Glycosyltransferase family 1 protein n=1 Tax=Ilyomonas limi TaxID=2575867 RepID=A0A4U3KSD3_9BACT|nr:glycosyltransferase [Ilyomonas limi]TKK65230.1 glycosyltransferase family 1 protein [Ilyomonas limi]